MAAARPSFQIPCSASGNGESSREPAIVRYLPYSKKSAHSSGSSTPSARRLLRSSRGRGATSGFLPRSSDTRRKRAAWSRTCAARSKGHARELACVRVSLHRRSGSPPRKSLATAISNVMESAASTVIRPSSARTVPLSAIARTRPTKPTPCRPSLCRRSHACPRSSRSRSSVEMSPGRRGSEKATVQERPAGLSHSRRTAITPCGCDASTSRRKRTPPLAKATCATPSARSSERRYCTGGAVRSVSNSRKPRGSAVPN
jgi:hypothetical protein